MMSVRKPKSTTVNTNTAKLAHVMIGNCLCLNHRCHNRVLYASSHYAMSLNMGIE